MEQTQQQEKEILISFDVKHFEKFFLPILIVTSLGILLWVTFNSNIIFGDESFHTHSSRWIAKNLEIPKFIPLYGANLYKLAYTKYIAAHASFAGLFYAFGFSESIVKFFVPLLSIMTAIVMYRFVKNYFSKKVAYLSFFILVSTPIYLTYSVLYYSDVFLMFFLMLSIYFFFESLQKHSIKYAALAGVFTALSILTKKSGLALLFLFVLWFLYKFLSKRDLKILKPLGIVVVVTFVLVLPWFVRNLVFFETVECGYPYFPATLCRQGPEEPLQDVARTPSVSGTETSLSQFGLINLVEFMYSKFFFLLALIGLFLLLIRSTETDRFGLALFLIFVLFLGQQTLVVGSYRVEDFAREFLPSVIPLVIGVAVFLSEAYGTLTQIKQNYIHLVGSFMIMIYLIYELATNFSFANLLMPLVAATYLLAALFNKKYNQMLGGMFVILILFFSFSAAFSKAGVMNSIKQFVPGFYEGSRWIKENTPLNANVLSLWTHQTVYTTERNSFWPQGHYTQIFGTNNQTAIDTIKSYGFDYIFIQKWSIADGLYYQNYPLSFINFLNGNNLTFTKTFENNEVIIYRVN